MQQLSHLGFKHFRIFDPDVVEDTNLNRLVGASVSDGLRGTPKVEVASRTIKGLQPDANILRYSAKWQDAVMALRSCDLVFGCLDGFAARRDLEACTRRYMIPYVDIGMDVHCLPGEPPRMAGQVILSMPGGPCMSCLRFLKENLAKEAAAYGDAGPRPQVIWPNAILASTAVGVAVDLLTGWTRSDELTVFYQYDGNKGLMVAHPTLPYLPSQGCPHYPLDSMGDPIGKPL